MLQTYKSIREVAGSIDVKDNRELVMLFKQVNETDYDTSPIIAKIFVENFGLMSNISNIYCSISEENKASICLESIYKALKNYSCDKPVKFITYLSTIFTNDLKSEITSQNADKRIVEQESCSIDKDMVSSDGEECTLENLMTYENNVLNKGVQAVGDYELIDFIENSRLTDMQKEICTSIINDKLEYQKGLQVEIAKKLGVNRSCISIHLKNIRNSKVFSNLI